MNYGFNHIGLVVNDIDNIEEKLIEVGYNKGIDTPKKPLEKESIILTMLILYVNY